MKKYLIILLMSMILVSNVFCNGKAEEKAKEISFLILPKFEIPGEFPGEAQYYIDEYFSLDYEEYKISGNSNSLLLNKDKIALIITGMGLEESGQTLTTILNDKRFNLQNCYFISTGCAGGPIERTQLGDVILGMITINHDLGHLNDYEDLPSDKKNILFVRDKNYDFSAYTELNKDLIIPLYEIVKNIKLEDTERSKEVFSLYNTENKIRSPQVQIGGILSGNNYWAGKSSRNRVEYIFSQYDSTYPYMITEMEDSALAIALKRFDKTENTNYLSKFIIIRDVVDFDYPPPNQNILNFWKETSENNSDFDWGIFQQAMLNNFKIGKSIISYLQSKN